MKKYIVAAIAAMLASAATEASAFTSIGKVQAITGHMVVIQDGDAYRLPAEFDLSHIKVGQKVAVTWQSQDPGIIEVGNESFVKVLDATDIVVAE